MQIEIKDSALAGFNDLAKRELTKATLVFADDLLKESIRIEASNNSAGSTRQITSGMVVDAAMVIRRHLARPRQKLGVKLVRIGAAVLSMVVGFTYNATRLQDELYMVMFLVVAAMAIFLVILSTMLE
ncbi:hypothetical protein HHL21_11165 [Massilia sp. RP-1-19]|uniref:Uncharacterized protein n=1 Tax=Massilia polaris TaxID=2728846 RepID=A0A848HNB9_9BURK|nr:hypothetical protein [Massilia polaris]NML61629.1 hypothetical protein [Massilia polaris]